MSRLVAMLALALVACAPQPATGGGSPDGCHGDAIVAEDACTAIVNYLAAYGCRFSGACDVSCPESEGICAAEVDDCEAVASETLPGVAPADLPSVCAEVDAYCNRGFVCRPVN